MDLIILGAVGLIIGLAVGYIIKEKKKGRKCIGCPDSSTCGGYCSSCSFGCSCSSDKDSQKDTPNS